MEETKKGASLQVQAVNDSHAATIDEFYINGFNGSKAVNTVTGGAGSANRVKWSYIIGHKGNAAYIARKRAELRRKTDIHNEHILRELIQWAYMDATDYMTLTPAEVKELPPDVRRCIQSFKSKEHSYTDRNGTSHTEKTIEIKLIDKIKAVEMINKHIGFYEMDNSQKAARVNIGQLNNTTINTLLQAMTQAEGEQAG